jgi:GH25 family lysozyme M1 (1,4-beta-N-acetylmuramidase)
MVDVEDWGTGGWVTQAWKNNDKEKVRNNTLRWINYVEKKLGITPWIYASDSVNKAFFWNDSRFSKYKKWIARYWGTPTQSDMHQYSYKWKVWWFNHSVDLNSTSNVEQFLA